jgi:hypothetical protein
MFNRHFEGPVGECLSRHFEGPVGECLSRHFEGPVDECLNFHRKKMDIIVRVTHCICIREDR